MQNVMSVASVSDSRLACRVGTRTGGSKPSPKLRATIFDSVELANYGFTETQAEPGERTHMSKKFTLQAPIDLYGAFWRPEESDKVFTGRLAREGRFLQLTTSPIYKPTLDYRTDLVLPGSDSERIDILHGFTAEGACALLWLQSPYKAGVTDFAVEKALIFRQYRVALCMFDVLPPTPESLFFSEAMFEFSGLHEWLPVLPTKSRLETGSWSISYPDRSPFLEFSLAPDNTRFKLDVIPVMEHKRSGEVQSKHHSQLVVAPEHPQHIKWYLELSSRFENFFSLLLGTSVRLERFEVKHDETIGSVVSADRSKKQPTDFTVWAQCSAPQLQTAMTRWLSQPEEFGSLEGLVYGTIRQSSLFVETEFLSLAQALESFHRISSTDKKSKFAQRIKALLAQIPDQHRKQLIGDDENNFVNTLKNTRNYFTRRSEERRVGKECR